ncbi:hypothetical protein FHN55_10345 [Streptomyces sp. NP160]|uniref:HAAS signaling domain-containing protein n=1 Tax=Streptomyces sp. NP160 TaxID=2586637 RepID=UPI00111A9A03|nr:hypothetical protein [Streptomyces sp. NP160]TNM67448.1 hypothetical protein FHN55_10345 [Streptomyces sp. NP160]
MSTTLPVPAPGPSLDPAAEARGYAAAVRAELADLPAEVVEELTGGLEADLAELAAESSTPLLDRLGSPRAYAAELRSSAGLADRSGAAPAPERRGLWERTADAVREDRERLLGALRARPWWPGAVERGVQLRPAWWVLRGAVGGWLLASVLDGRGVLGLLVVVAAVAASVEAGRRTWTEEWQRNLLVAGNVLAVVVLPFALAAVVAGPREVYVYPSSTTPDGSLEMSQGVWSDGQVVTNIYPYDAQGRPLTGVQLLDDYGRPLVTSTGDKADWSGGGASPLVPTVSTDGALRWNAYPLRAQAGAAGAAPTTPPLPEPTLPPLVGYTADGGSAAAPVPSATATATAPASGAPAPLPATGTAPAGTAPADGETAVEPVVVATAAPTS